MATTTDRQVNKAARLIAPLAAFGATLVVRRFLENRYRNATGNPIPAAKDLRVTFIRTLVWSTAMAVVTTTVQVAVVRAIDRAGSAEPEMNA